MLVARILKNSQNSASTIVAQQQLVLAKLIKVKIFFRALYHQALVLGALMQ